MLTVFVSNTKIPFIEDGDVVGSRQTDTGDSGLKLGTGKMDGAIPWLNLLLPDFFVFQLSLKTSILEASMRLDNARFFLAALTPGGFVLIALMITITIITGHLTESEGIEILEEVSKVMGALIGLIIGYYFSRTQGGGTPSEPNSPELPDGTTNR